MDRRMIQLKTGSVRGLRRVAHTGWRIRREVIQARRTRERRSVPPAICTQGKGRKKELKSFAGRPVLSLECNHLSHSRRI